MLKLSRSSMVGCEYRHRHPWFELVHVLSGDYRVHVDDSLLYLPEGGTIFYPPRCPHRPVDTAAKVIVARWRASRSLPTDDMPRFSVGSSYDILAALLWLESWSDRATGSHLFADAVDLLRVVLALHRSGLTGDESDATSMARTLLSRNLDRGIDVPQLASEVGLSVSHLSRSFRDRYGVSLMTWRRGCRLNHAMDLLCVGGLSLNQIAMRCGYATGAHLSNLLKKERGFRPADLRGSRDNQDNDLDC